MKFKKELSVTHLLFLSVGSILGSGWLFGAYYTAKTAGPASLISWIIGGFLVGFVALTYAELCSSFPITGGTTVLPYLWFGKLTGFIYSWVGWLWPTVVAPIETQAILQYASTIFPKLIVAETHKLTAFGFLIAIGIMILLVAINVAGVKIMANINSFITIWKIFIPILVFFVLFLTSHHPLNLVNYGGLAPYGIKGILESISVGGISFSFFGFQTVIFLAGEAKNPKKTLPIALFGGMGLCLLIYLLIQYAFLTAITIHGPVNDPGVWKYLSFTEDAGPFYGIFTGLSLYFMAKIILSDAIFSPLGTAIGYVAGSSRILYSIADQKDAPKFLSQINTKGVPVNAILVNFLIGILFFIPFSGWQSMVSFLSAAIVFTYSIGPLVLPYARSKSTNSAHSFRVPFLHFTCILSFFICNLLLLWSGWEVVSKLLFFLLFGIIYFCIKSFFQKEEKFKNLKIINSIWVFLYIGCFSVTAYFSVYGLGIGKLLFGYDIVAVFVYSIFIFFLAQKSLLNKKTNDHEMLPVHSPISS